jgi:hypothetical protein
METPQKSPIPPSRFIVVAVIAGSMSELWRVPLVWLSDRRKMSSIGVSCNGCGNSRSWPIAELIQ